MAKRNPAQFNDAILATIRDLLQGGTDAKNIVDPFAGEGGVHKLREYGYQTVGIELEPEWAHANDLGRQYTVAGDSLEFATWQTARAKLISQPTPAFGPGFDTVVVSPTYGNRFADQYVDHTVRHTYRAALERPLTEGSSGGMQWGVQYRIFHTRAWYMATANVRAGKSWFVLNCKDHYRTKRGKRFVDGKYVERQRVTQWHDEVLQGLGWSKRLHAKVPVTGNRNGENADRRVKYESVILYERA